MQQIYYVWKTLLYGRAGNLIKVVSLGLGLTMSILLFCNLAYNQSIDTCFKEYDNLYQYDLTQDQINECLVHNSQMPRLSAVIQDMLSYNIKPDQIHEYVDDLKSGDKYPNSKYKKYLLSDLKERNLKKLEKDEMVFEVMEDMYVDDMLHGHNVFKDEKNDESGNIKQG